MSSKSQTRGLQLKVPPGGLVLRIFTSWKNPLTSAEFQPANLGSRGEHVTPRPPRPTNLVFYDIEYLAHNEPGEKYFNSFSKFIGKQIHVWRLHVYLPSNVYILCYTQILTFDGSNFCSASLASSTGSSRIIVVIHFVRITKQQSLRCHSNWILE